MSIGNYPNIAAMTTTKPECSLNQTAVIWCTVEFCNSSTASTAIAKGQRSGGRKPSGKIPVFSHHSGAQFNITHYIYNVPQGLGGCPQCFPEFLSVGRQYCSLGYLKINDRGCQPL